MFSKFHLTTFTLRVALSLATLGAGACSSSRSPPPAPPAAAEIIDANIPLRCKSREQCDRWWRAAQIWLVQDTTCRVQVATDIILQTNCSESNLSWEFQLHRASAENGSEEILVKLICLSAPQCRPAYETVLASFKRELFGTR